MLPKSAPTAITPRWRLSMSIPVGYRNLFFGCRSIILVTLLLWLVSASVISWANAATVTASAPQRTKTFFRTPKRQHNDQIPASTSSAQKVISKNTNQAWLNGLKSGAASASAAACVKTLLQPIDAIKTVQQFHEGSTALTVVAACRQLLARPGGILNFYSGLLVTVFGAMPGVSLYFGVYSYCKQRFLNTDRGRRHPSLCVAMSAAIGNSVASFSRVPYEVMKQKLQTGIYTSTSAAFADLVANPSTAMQLLFPKGGVWGQMIRDIPYAVVTLLIYESLQDRFASDANGKAKPSQSLNFILGGAAGGIGSWVTTPMDVVKTRLQTADGGGNIFECYQQVWQEGGPSAFMRGAIPRLMHKIPANSLFFMFFEAFKRLYQVDNEGASGLMTSKQR